VPPKITEKAVHIIDVFGLNFAQRGKRGRGKTIEEKERVFIHIHRSGSLIGSLDAGRPRSPRSPTLSSGLD
jgi:hypothetical protein